MSAAFRYNPDPRGHGCLRPLNGSLPNGTLPGYTLPPDFLPCPDDFYPGINATLPSGPFNGTFGPGGPFNGTMMGPGMGPGMNRTGPQFVACPTALDLASLNGTIVITTFVLAANTSFPFGFNNTLQAPANSFKFNIEAYDWPFCNSNNSLALDVFVSTDNVTEPKAMLDSMPGAPGGTRPDLRADSPLRARLEYPPGQVTAVQLPPYATDGPNGTQTFPVGIHPAGMPGQTGFTIVFPAGRSIYYDPIVAADNSISAAELGVASNTTTITSTSSAKNSASAGHRAAGGLAFVVPALLLILGLTGM